MRNLIKSLVGLGILAALFVIYQSLLRPLDFDGRNSIRVERGEGYYALVERLEADHGLKFAPIAKAYTQLLAGLSTSNSLYAGSIKVSDQPSFFVLMRRMNTAKDNMIQLVVIEGTRSEDLLRRLKNTDGVESTLADQSDEAIAETLGLPVDYLEGWFAPDTYRFARGVSDLEVLQHLSARQQKIMAQAWARRSRKSEIKTPEEMLIMASIIEKESAKHSEYGMISGVFNNRLAIDMKLQTDPTVIYGMRHRYNGNIRKADLREKTIYNTYVIKGLPPTPIALPGEQAMRAAVRPDRTDALYFMADGTGGHTFSATYDEHKVAVKKYWSNR